VRPDPRAKLPKPLVQQIRPVVPEESLAGDAQGQPWAVGDAVDAKAAADDGWWEGYITSIDVAGTTFTVALPDEPNEPVTVTLAPDGDGRLRRTRVWTGTSWLVAPFPLPAAAAAAPAAGGGAAKQGPKKVKLDVPPYVVPPDFDAAAAGIPAANGESVSAFERCSSVALATRWASLRESVPAGEREAYQKGEHMRGHDLVLFEQARAEVWHVQGHVGQGLKVTMKTLIMYSKRQIRAMGYLQPVMVNSDSESEGLDDDADDAQAETREGGRSARKAAIKGRERLRKSAADTGLDGSDNDPDASSVSGSGEEEDDGDNDDGVAASDNDGEPERSASAGRGRGRGRGRGQGRGRGRGRSSRARGVASRSEAAATLLAPYDADVDEFNTRFGVTAAHHSAAGHRRSITAATALQRFSSVAGMAVAWCPTLTSSGSASLLAVSVRSGHVLLWRVSHTAAAAPATCLGAHEVYPTATAAGQWPTAMSFGASVLLTGGSRGSVALTACDVASCGTAQAWALESAGGQQLACTFRLATPSGCDGVPVSSACIDCTDASGSTLRAAVAHAWHVTVWWVTAASLAASPPPGAGPCVASSVRLQVPHTSMVPGLAWARLTGALCAISLEGVLSVWLPADAADTLQPVPISIQTGGSDKQKLGIAAGLALSPHGTLAVAPRLVPESIKPGIQSKFAPDAGVVMHSLPCFDATTSPADGMARLASLADRRRLPGASLCDVAHTVRRLAAPLGNDEAQQAASRAVGAMHDTRTSAALRRALGAVMPHMRTALDADLPALEMESLAQHATQALADPGTDASSRVRWASLVEGTSAWASRTQLVAASRAVLAPLKGQLVPDPCPMCSAPLAAPDTSLVTVCRGSAPGEGAHAVPRCVVTLAPRGGPGATWTCPGCERGAGAGGGDCPLCGTALAASPLGAHPSIHLIPSGLMSPLPL
jgi:hypothetical protein